MCVRVFIYGVQHVEMPTCIFFFCALGGEGFASSRRGPLGVASADRSGDKAAETELTTCWTVLATDVPEQITGRMRWHFLKMWMCTFKLWCEHDFPRKEKRNALFVWFTWSPLQNSYILYAYAGPFCCCCCCFVIVSVDLGTFGGMRNEGEKNGAHCWIWLWWHGWRVWHVGGWDGRRSRPQQHEVIFFSSRSTVAACCRAVERRRAIPENEIKQMFTSKSCRADATSSCWTEGFFCLSLEQIKIFFCFIIIDFHFWKFFFFKSIWSLLIS